LRREQIRLQVALITPLIHVKGYAAPETKTATERARVLIEKSEALGEHPEDPLLLFSILYGFAIANFVRFDGDTLRDLATQFPALAEKQKAVVPIMIGRRLTGHSLLLTGHIAEGRAQYDRVIALYDPSEHRSRAVKHAREISHVASLLLALTIGSLTHIYCGSYAAANTQSDEAISLADQRGIIGFKGAGMAGRGLLLALTGGASEAVQMIVSGVNDLQSTGGTLNTPIYLSGLATAYASLGQTDDASRSIANAMTLIEATDQHFLEADTCRTAGEIALMSPHPDLAKAEAYFDRALSVARQQQAKSWELRAAMSMARLWRSQGKRDEARELLAPVYGWFTEGFDTLDLKEAKGLLDEPVA
jgi:tetratricopeptide (TPR) repeat protein